MCGRPRIICVLARVMHCFLKSKEEFKLSMYVSFDNEIVLQCFTIIAQYIGCNLLCFATGIRLVQASLFLSTIDHDPTYLIGQHLLLHSTISTEERRKQAAYMPPL